MNEDLRVTEIEITNFEQIENLTIRPGAVTVITGRNDSGKTSALNAIRSLFDLGHDPAMVRHGSEKAIVRMTLSDGSTLVNTITRKGMDVKVRNAEGTVLPAPKTLTKQMADGMSYDVVKFLRMPKKERAAYLEKLMPMTVSAEEILKRIENRAHAPKIAEFLRETEYDLNGLQQLREKFYQDRSVVNREIKRLDGTIDTERKALPANYSSGDDLSEHVRAAEDKLADLRDAKSAEKDAAADGAKLAADQVDADLKTAIRQLEIEAAEKNATIRANLETDRQRIDAEHDPKIEAAAAELGEIRQQTKDLERLRGIAADLERHRGEVVKARREVEVLDDAMAAIDRARAHRLKETPIKGLSVVGGDVLYQKPGEDEPISFDLHNQATQMLLAIQIGMLGSQRLPIIVCDGFEAFDDATRADLIDRLAKSDFQVLAGRVTNGELDQEVVGAAR